MQFSDELHIFLPMTAAPALTEIRRVSSMEAVVFGIFSLGCATGASVPIGMRRCSFFLS